MKRRIYIVATIFIAIICNYLDRQLLSILKPEILEHFRIGDVEYAWIVNIFLICYAIMYPVSGILVDKFGPKKVLLGGIVVWSLACIGGGLSNTVWQFSICRGLLGLAEPTIFAGQIVAVTLWFERKKRATANSICQAGGSIGTVVAPLLIAWLSRYLPWQDVFMVAGAIGLVIAVFWCFIYKNPPAEVLALTVETESADSDEKKSAPAFSWGALWGTKSLWGCLLVRLISDPVWYFCCFWLPGFLRDMGQAQGLSHQETLDMIQYVGGIPFFIGAIGGVLAGFWSDSMVKRGMPSLKARKVMMVSLVVFAPLCMLTPLVSNAAGLSFDVRLYLIIGIFSLTAVMCLSWLYTIMVVIAESFPLKNVASVSGICCGAGAIGGTLFNLIVGYLMSTMGGMVFIIMGCLHIIASVCLIKLVHPETPKPSQIAK
ncbi:MAG: MFS transporter [Bacteroidales bacterium]|nr:MFS transporter [Bacteroidales bacterium]